MNESLIAAVVSKIVRGQIEDGCCTIFADGTMSPYLSESTISDGSCTDDDVWLEKDDENV